jgi:hypothetical protein
LSLLLRGRRKRGRWLNAARSPTGLGVRLPAALIYLPAGCRRRRPPTSRRRWADFHILRYESGRAFTPRRAADGSGSWRRARVSAAGPGQRRSRWFRHAECRPARDLEFWRAGRVMTRSAAPSSTGCPPPGDLVLRRVEAIARGRTASPICSAAGHPDAAAGPRLIRQDRGCWPSSIRASDHALRAPVRVAPPAPVAAGQTPVFHRPAISSGGVW